MSKNKIPEAALMKAMAEIEGQVEKSDALDDGDPEGGFSTEGTPLSNAAPSGRSDTKKSDGDDGSDDDAEKAFPPSDDDSSSGDDDDDKKAPPFKKKTKKSFPPAKGKGDDSSSDDDDDDDDAEKSFRDVADGNETLSKGMEISDFLESLVDQFSLTLITMTKGLQKSMTDLESRLNARIDNRVAKSVAITGDFNSRLAKAVAQIGKDIQEQDTLLKSFGNQPAAPRGRAVLSKGEVHQPPWGGHGQEMANGSSDYSELSNVASEKIGEWLFQKSTRNEIDSRLILAWEANRYDPMTLPEAVQKSLFNDLVK